MPDSSELCSQGLQTSFLRGLIQNYKSFLAVTPVIQTRQEAVKAVAKLLKSIFDRVFGGASLFVHHNAEQSPLIFSQTLCCCQRIPYDGATLPQLHSSPPTTPGKNLVAMKFTEVGFQTAPAISEVVQRLLQPICLAFEYCNSDQDEIPFTLILN